MVNKVQTSIKLLSGRAAELNKKRRSSVVKKSVFELNLNYSHHSFKLKIINLVTRRLFMP